MKTRNGNKNKEETKKKREGNEKNKGKKLLIGVASISRQ